MLPQELTRNLSTSTYTMITNGQVLKSCSTDGCNNPDDEIAGKGSAGCLSTGFEVTYALFHFELHPTCFYTVQELGFRAKGVC